MMTTPADPHVNPEVIGDTPIVGPESAIANRMEALRKTLAELTPEVTKLQQEQKSTWAWLKGGAGFVVFDILVTVAGLILGVNVYSVSHQNDALITQLQQQQTRLAVSIHETCNLYGTFIGFYSPAAKDRFAGGPAQYDQLYLVLQKSADNLQCGVKHVVPGT
jgi:hypothetical protein